MTDSVHILDLIAGENYLTDSSWMNDDPEMKEKIERWDWIASRWTQKDMMKVVNLLLKSDLIKEKHGQRVSKTNIRQVEFTLIENSLIVHQCLSNLINDTLVAKAKLKPSEKKLLREIRLAYRLFYDRVKCIRYGHNKK